MVHACMHFAWVGALSVCLSVSGLSEAEERVVSSLMDGGARQRRTLADIIMDKVRGRVNK